jgi:calcineurin-like phosphoesterase family protein
MDDIYLVEIRLGRTKWRIKKTVFAIERLYGIGVHVERHPHVTLSGPLSLKEGITTTQLLNAIESVAVAFDPVPFTLDGWETRKGMSGSVIAFRVFPSDALRKLTASIAGVLTPLIDSCNVWDSVPDTKWFHVTVANHLEPSIASTVFSELSSYMHVVPAQEKTPSGFFSRILKIVRQVLNRKEKYEVRAVTIDEAGLRITVMQGDSILAEYDLCEKCWIVSDHSHNSQAWQKTLSIYRQRAGFELIDPRLSDPDDIFLISDLHLGHANIIRYCSRPFFFPDVHEMDHVLIKNWNYTISSENRVYYLGDLRYGRDAAPGECYRNKLRGRITFLPGNHDNREPGTERWILLRHGGFRFCLVHDPDEVPDGFDGWVIHGHHHNNNLRSFPFINFEFRRINVSAEVLGYIPVNLNHICSLLHERLSGNDRTPILLNYTYCWE